MSELQSMLVGLIAPLETLPGWPAAPNPPLLMTLGLLVGFPLVAAAVIIGVSQLSALAKRGRGEDTTGGDAVWVGSKPPEVDGVEAPSALTAGEPAPAATRTGGASARW